MERSKGIKSRKWPIEDKVRNVNRYFNEGIEIKRLAREENVNHGPLNCWISMSGAILKNPVK